MKISVVMASYLGEYQGCASNREFKFKRAVDSFINQTYNNKELIIVSDGCDITESIYNELYKDIDNIILSKIEKDVTFGGKTRNRGIELASGEYICYLDSDDFLTETHLEIISKQISDEFDWYYSDDRLVFEYISLSNFKFKIRENIVYPDRIGTSSIIHKKNNVVLWGNGYGHDWRYVSELAKNFSKYKKIKAEYNVCHIPNLIDV